MPSVLPAGECIRRKSDCFRRLAVGERLPQRLRYRPEVNAVEKQLLLPDALPLGKGRCPRCPAVVERSLSPMPCRRRKCGCSLRTCRRRTVPWSLPLGKDRCFPMPCRWGKVVIPDAVGTACRGMHSPKERLFPADLPPANGFGKTACKHHLSFRKHPRRNQCPSPPAARRYSCAEDSLPQPCCPSGSALYCTRPASAALKTMCRPA